MTYNILVFVYYFSYWLDLFTRLQLSFKKKLKPINKFNTKYHLIWSSFSSEKIYKN